ncbi:CHY_zinc finger domain-containing protein [Hexamita inflata]|uniref:CHY_zinc finger domain-containing protein n=1 Tax=Hexamita inflata TaxID=28002 RepID=A0ABP1I8N5_9EUKA
MSCICISLYNDNGELLKTEPFAPNSYLYKYGSQISNEYEPCFPIDHYNSKISILTNINLFQDKIYSFKVPTEWLRLYDKRKIMYVKKFYQDLSHCDHFISNCVFSCANCAKQYSCRYCHDESEDHPFVFQSVHCLCGASLASCSCGRQQPKSLCEICGFASISHDFAHCQDCNFCHFSFDKSQFDQFHQINANNELNSIESCAVCLCSFDSFLFKPVFLSCSHCFHGHCIDQIRFQNQKIICPLDRSVQTEQHMQQAVMRTKMCLEGRERVIVTVKCACERQFRAQKSAVGYLCSCGRINELKSVQIEFGQENDDEKDEAVLWAENAINESNLEEKLKMNILGRETAVKALRLVRLRGEKYTNAKELFALVQKYCYEVEMAWQSGFCVFK